MLINEHRVFFSLKVEVNFTRACNGALDNISDNSGHFWVVEFDRKIDRRPWYTSWNKFTGTYGVSLLVVVMDKILDIQVKKTE